MKAMLNIIKCDKLRIAQDRWNSSSQMSQKQAELASGRDVWQVSEVGYNKIRQHYLSAVALLSAKIQNMSGHMRGHRKDFASRR